MSRAGSRTVGHPIDVATGVMTTSETDFAIPSRCELSLERYYSTAMPTLPGALFGPGWRCEYEVTLRKDLEGYTLFTAQGNAITFDESDQLPGEPLVIENQPAFHELRREGGWLIIAQWDEDGLVARYWFRERQGAATLVVDRIEDTPGQFRHVEYDGAGRIERVTESHGHRQIHWAHGVHGRVASVALVAGDERRVMATFEYDAAGRLSAAYDVVGVPCTYEYDVVGRMVRENTRDEGRFEFTYDARGRCVYTSGIDGYDRQRLTYFVEGHKTAVEDARGHTWVYEWRSDGQVERVISPLGNIEVTTYDEKGRIASRMDGEKHETRFAYDEHGNRCRVEPPDGTVEAFTYDARRQVVEHVDRCGAAWRWEYDEAGRQVAEVDPFGHRWPRSYDARGDLVSFRDPLGRKRAFRYDRRGDLVGVLQPGGGAVSLKRDLAGYIVEQVDEVGLTSRTVRDARGLPLQVHLPDGKTFQYEYSVAHDLREVVTPEGYRTVYRYGPCRRLLRVEQPDGSILRLTWNPVPGQLATLYNELGEVCSFEYDADGRMTREVDFGGAERHLGYDRAGRAVHVLTTDGSATEIERDGSGRVVRQRLADGEERTFEYDGEGRLVRATNADADVVLARDALGRVVREQQGNFVVESRYDAAGQRVGYRTSDRLDVAYEFDRGGRLLRLVADDGRGKPPWTSVFEHDLGGRLVSQLVPGEFSALWEYAPSGLIDTRSIRHGSDTTHRSRYRWKRFDQIATLSDSAHGMTRFEHDARGYLVTAQHDDGMTLHRVPDVAGNLYRSPLRNDRAYGSDGRLLEAGGTRYRYGRVGERIEKRLLDGTRWGYEWSSAGELRAVDRPDGVRVEFAYDALGRRVRKRVGSREVTFVWDGDSMIGERSSDGNTVAWLFGLDSCTPLTRITDDARHSLLCDHLGAPTAMLDEAGRLAWRAQLDLYGVAHADVATATCPWRWPGQYEDEETGLYYNRFRYYDPETGTYLCPDPAGLSGGLDRYAYVPDPLTWIDPLGLSGTDGCQPRQFPNLHGDEAVPVRRIRLEYDASSGRWSTHGGTRRFTARGNYIFVRTEAGIFVARRMQINGAAGRRVFHTDLAGGHPVLYAGEVRFGYGRSSRGVIRSWDNGSGHYQPLAEYAHQAGLPMDLFRSVVF